MEASTVGFKPLATSSKQFARQLLTIGENRLELLAVEVQEGREHLLHALLMALGVAAFGMLASLTLTAAIVVLLWAYSPVVVLLTLTALCAVAGVCFYRRLTGLLRDWQTLAATLEQLQKDRKCLEALLA
ncbi:MAG TPA: phage holin family protein [Verrucomicrobiae bacterium]|nr:phage holin family protein [Verrucomicrobiae bacterium]